jgi:hypothetical protein
LLTAKANAIAVWFNGGQVKRSFDDARSKVEECKTDFEREANFAHIESSSRVHKALVKSVFTSIEVKKVTTIPFGRNASFVCRDDVLQRIEEGLYPRSTEPRSGTRSCVIHGMGGVGKTQTGLEFAYRLCKPDCCIFWLRAEKPADLAETFGRIAIVLNLGKEADIQDQTQLITLAQQWLSKSESTQLSVYYWLTFWQILTGY